MAIPKSASVGSISIGFSLLVLTLISVICGVVAISKMRNPATVSIGLWGLYFVVPAVLSILAGYKKNSILLAAALGAHILGVVLAVTGMIISASFWAILGSSCTGAYSRCHCRYNNETFKYEASCSDLETVRGANGAVTIIFAIIVLVSVIGSIYGCYGTCCAPRTPTVIVRTVQPSTVTMMNAPVHHTNHQQPPPYVHSGAFGQDPMVINSKP